MPTGPGKATFRRQALWTACSVLCIAILAAVWTDAGGWTTRLNALLKPRAAIGGAFSLSGTDGRTVTQKDLLGRPTLVFFGYTYCPDVCPTTLFEVSNWLRKLGPDGDKIQVFFVTVDPGRDTLEHLASYMSAFDPRIVGLTGSPDSVRRIIEAFRVFAERVEGDEPESYLMNHTASLYLMGKDGQFVDLIAYQEDEAKALAKLRYVIRS